VLLQWFAVSNAGSTGANEFAGRYTEGHFDVPVFGCDIELDGVRIIDEGELLDVFG
jgi:2,5-dihydroxypyridine 5,6-dioxygenase